MTPRNGHRLSRTAAWIMIAWVCAIPMVFMTWYKYVFSAWDEGFGEENDYAYIMTFSAIAAMCALGIPAINRLSKKEP